MLSKKTVKKIKSLMAKIGQNSIVVANKVANNRSTLAKSDFVEMKNSIVADLNEIRKVYVALKGLVSNRSNLIKASSSKSFDEILEITSNTATRLDIINSVLDYEIQALEEDEIDEDVTADDILDDMGVSEEDDETDEELEDEELDDETDEELEDEELEDEELEDEELEFESTKAKKSQKSIKAKKSVKKGVTSVRKSASNSLSALWDGFTS